MYLNFHKTSVMNKIYSTVKVHYFFLGGGGDISSSEINYSQIVFISKLKIMKYLNYLMFKCKLVDVNRSALKE